MAPSTPARTLIAGTTAIATLLLPVVSTPQPAVASMVHTSFGAHYDPAKCSIVAARWKGQRRFYVSTTADSGCFSSPWFEGKHPVLLSYGRTAAPWYASHVHHGIDIDLPVGTPVYSRRSGKVYIRPSTLGPAYGANRMLVRSGGRDYVLGHMSKLVVRNKQWVKAGQLLGYSGMSGTENMDGPHLHFEVRPAGTRYTDSLDPSEALRAKRA